MLGLPGWLSSKECACQCKKWGFSPWTGRSPGVGNGNTRILAWGITWTEGPGRLQFKSWNLVTKQQQHSKRWHLDYVNYQGRVALQMADSRS